MQFHPGGVQTVVFCHDDNRRKLMRGENGQRVIGVPIHDPSVMM